MDKPTTSGGVAVQTGEPARVAVDVAGIQAKKHLAAVDSFLKEGRGDASFVKSWVARYDSEKTIDLAEKEAARLFLWMRTNGVHLDSFDSGCARAYLNNLADPKPRELWVGKRCQKVLKDGRLNPNWRPLAGGLSANSVRLSYAMCRSFFAYLDDEGFRSGNPFAGLRIGQIKTSRSASKTRSSLSTGARECLSESLRIAESKNPAKGARLQWILNLLMVTGLRRKECVDAKVEHLIHLDGSTWLEVVGKGNVRGRVPIPDFLLSMMLKYLVANGLKVSSVESLLMNHPALPLVGAYLHPGNAITNEALWHAVKKISVAAAKHAKAKGLPMAVVSELESMSTHWLRHTCASVQLNELGLSVVQVRDNLRHSNISTTSNYLSGDDSDRHKMVSAWKVS